MEREERSIVKPLVIAILIGAGLCAMRPGEALAACRDGNSSISPCVRTYGEPAARAASPIDPRVSRRALKPKISVGRPEVFDPGVNDRAPFLRREQVGRNLFFSGSDARGNLVIGTCVNGRCN